MSGQAVPPLAVRQRPGLSETLPQWGTALLCRNCGATLAWENEALSRGVATGTPWMRWVECDAWDEPTGAVVFLCEPCGARLIDRHPRMYHGLSRYTAHPGAVPLCEGCPHNDAWRCAMARLNRGPGVYLTQRAPDVVHVLYAKRVNGSRGAWLKQYHEYPVGCHTPDRSFTRGVPMAPPDQETP